MDKLSHHIVKNRAFYFIVSCALILIMLFMTRIRSFDSAFENLGFEGNEVIQDQKIIDSIFERGQTVFLELVPTNQNYYQLEEDLRALELALEQRFHITNFRSLHQFAGFYFNSEEKNTIGMDSILTRLAGQQWLSDLISRDQKSFLITFDIPVEPQAIILQKIQDALNESNVSKDYTVRETSYFHVEYAINGSMQKDLILILGLLFLSFVIIMFISYRKLFAALYLVSMLALSLMVSVFVFTWSGSNWNMINIMVLAIVLVLMAANAVHILTGYYSISTDDPAHEKMFIVYKKYLLPSSLTALTTAFAFFTLLFNDTKSVYELGWVSGSAIIISFILCYLMSPWLFRFAGKRDLRRHIFLDLAQWFIKRKKIFTFVLSPAVLISLFLLPQLKFKNNFDLFIPQGTKQEQDLSILRSRFDTKGVLDYVVILNGPKTSFPQQLKAIHDRIAALSNISAVLDVSQDNTIVTPFLLTVDMGEITGFNQKFAKPKDGIYRFQLSLVDHLKSLQVESELKEISKEFEVKEDYISGRDLIFENINVALGSSLMKSLVSSAIFLFLVFILLTRSIRQSLIGLYANLVPLSFIVIIFVAFDLHINVMTAVTAVVCLGIIVDDTIHSFYRRVVRKRPLNELGFGMITTTLILAVGFGIHGVSCIVPVTIFGMVAASIFIITLICDFTILLYLNGKYEEVKGLKYED